VPNGAGKSTAVSLLLGLRRPGSGRVLVFGRDPRDPIALRRECEQLAHIAHAVPLARLQIPSDFAALPDVRGAVLADIRSSSR